MEKVPLETRLEIVAQAAEGLQAAHDSGIIHRDVKPGNILVSGDLSGSKPLVVKLTDFGIGQVISAEYLAGVTKAGFTQTMLGTTGTGTGTTMYLAPEIVAGMPATTRSDIYSLGVVLYQMLIGDFRRPVTTDWADGIPDLLLRDDLKHCFTGNPSDRFAGAGQLAKNLRSWERRREELSVRQRTQQQAVLRHRIAVASACVAALFLVVAVALGYGMNKAERARQLQRRYAYASDMKAAQVAIQQNNRGLGMRLLRRHVPRAGEEDLRGIEWRYLWQECQGDERQSFPHADIVNTAVLAPDGQHLVTASGDGQVYVWKAGSSRVIRRFDTIKFWGPRKSVGFSPDGKWLAIARRGSIELRDTTDWSMVQELKSAGEPLCFSPQGGCLVAQGANGIKVWDLGKGNHRVLTNARADWNNLAFHPDGKRLFCCRSAIKSGRIHQIQEWDVETGIRTTIGEPDCADSLAISPDGKWLASGNWDGNVCFWDLASRRLVQQFPAHRGLVFAVVFSPDSQLLATGGNDELIQLWRTGTTNKVRTLHGHQNEIWSLEFSKDGKSLVSASKDGTAKLWAIKAGQNLRRAFALPAGSTPIGRLPDASALVAANSEQRMTQLWSVPDGRLLRSFLWDNLTQQGAVNFRCFPQNEAVVGVTTNGIVHVWSLKTGAHLRSVQLGGTELFPRCLSVNNRWLLCGKTSEIPAVQTVCDLQTGRRLCEFHDFRWCGSFSPDGRWLAYATTNRAIRLWDLAANREKPPLLQHRWYVDSIAFSPGGAVLASCGVDGDVSLWSANTGMRLSPPLRGHQSGGGSAVFSSDSRTLVTSSADLTMRWWNVATGQEMLFFQNILWMSSPGEDTRAEWDPEGRMLLWQERSGLLRVAALPTLAEIDAAEKAQGSAGGQGVR